jgi:hypothetical protein
MVYHHVMSLVRSQAWPLWLNISPYQLIRDLLEQDKDDW